MCCAWLDAAGRDIRRGVPSAPRRTAARIYDRVTSQLYQRAAATLVLPYQYDVLAVARRFLDADMYDVAVIMARPRSRLRRTTWLLRSSAITTSRRHRAWISERIERSTTLRNETLYELTARSLGTNFAEIRRRCGSVRAAR